MCTSIIYLNVKEKKFFQKATGDITGVNVAIAFLCLLNKPVFLELKFKMIVLPYTGLNISMGLILPEEGTTASQILVSLASNGYNKNFVYFRRVIFKHKGSFHIPKRTLITQNAFFKIL